MESNTQSSSRIFINPKFKKAYINPNFIAQQAKKDEHMEQKVNNIHINPKFYDILKHQCSNLSNESSTTLKKTSRKLIRVPESPINMKICDNLSESQGTFKMSEVKPIIKKTSRKLVRVPASPVNVPNKTQLAPFLKISKNKMIRSQINPPIKSTTFKVKSPALVKKTYKLVNKVSPVVRRRRLSFVKKYSIVSGSSKKLSTLRTTPSKNKKLVLVNINGTVYRASKNKLQKSNSSTNLLSTTKSTKAKDNVFTIRGIKFELDGNGTKLHRVESKTKTPPKVKRIDIGGLTFVSKNDGTFVKTNSHETRSYLSNVKQKSIKMLANKMTKNNVPCPIYRRIGKCLAFTRGKCPRVHDPKHISICQKFLKGECTKENCLLSHNVSLEKMPTCKYFLQGCCVRNNCPYLHKKLSDQEMICLDFLKGFCVLADQCQKRHEYLCPDFERKGKCDKTKCPHPHIGSSDLKRAKKMPLQESIGLDKLPTSRYYGDCEKSVCEKDMNDYKVSGKSDIISISDSDDEENDAEVCGLMKRPKIGDLPSFIPI